MAKATKNERKNEIVKPWPTPKPQRTKERMKWLSHGQCQATKNERKNEIVKPWPKPEAKPQRTKEKMK